jgi:ribosomal protein S18 acetylase RimI-like enzyme
VDFTIAEGGGEHLDELRELWLQMLEHHRAIVGDAAPVQAPATSWERARDRFGGWLRAGGAILRIARAGESGEAIGFALCYLESEGPTFALGPQYGEVDSLVVSDSARGAGVGTALLDAVRVELERRGVRYWAIGVLAQNTRAAELYGRLGFRPWSEFLLAETSAS